VLRLSTRINIELLCSVARAVISNIELLIKEGLRSHIVERVLTHALALTDKVHLLDHDHRRHRMHAVGLWTALAELSGPLSRALLAQLDDALGDHP
jgi:hypothetical protein